jgi:hypothetical protein
MLAYNDVLDELQDYILDEDHIDKLLKMKLSPQSQQVKVDKQRVIQKVVRQPALFVPAQQDSLFWCFYILKNGDASYETLNNKNSLVAKQQKIDLVSVIRKNKDIVKTYKFDTITNLESNLANDDNLSLKTFLSLCAIENINVVYVSNKTYYEAMMNDSGVIYIVREIQSPANKYHKKYGFELSTAPVLDVIRNTLYKLEVVDKPIRAASAYKLQDLIDICGKLDIAITNKETGKNKSKNDLYESIVQYF